MPGSIVQTVSAPPARTGPTDTGTAFVAALFEKGPRTPQLITSITQARKVYGKETAYSQAATHLEAMLRIGVSRVWAQRILGPGATAASITLNAGATPSVKFTANDVGAFANGWKASIVAGTASAIRFVLTDADGTELVRSGDLADKAALLAYTGASAYGTFSSAGAGATPSTSSPANLTGGTDDNANVTDTERQAALNKLPAKLGPGQVLMPGDTRQQTGAMLLAHAAANNRHALIDLPDDPSAAALTSAALALRANTAAGYGQAVGPWAQAPAAVPGGKLRDIPYSVVQAGVIARQDKLTGNPNEPAAGDNGIAPWIVGVKYAFTEGELDTLNDAGANIALDLYGNGQIRMYGNRTLVDPATDRLYLQASNVRLDMLIKARGRAIADHYVHRQVDGKGRVASTFAGQLEAMLSKLAEHEALFPRLDEETGDELDPGYDVDAGPQINTPATLEALQLRAVIGARRSPGAEFVYLEIINHLTTEAM